MKHLLLFLLVIFAGVLPSCLAASKSQVLIVSPDGTGDFTSIQAAINAVPDSSENRTLIMVHNGQYVEKIVVPVQKQNITLVGEDRYKTMITWDDFVGRGSITTSTSYTLYIAGDGFIARNLSVMNTAGAAGQVIGQAVAVHIVADRCIFENCGIFGNQDTLYANGDGKRQYFENCYIDGTTDFIFGSATAVFLQCKIHSKKNSYITAASTPQGQTYGYVFIACTLTADPEVDQVYLGRPWRDYATVAFLHCAMGAHIRPEGWHNWGQPSREKTARYREYKNTGAGAQKATRVPWAGQLTDKEAAVYTHKNIFGKWKPIQEIVDSDKVLEKARKS